MNRGVSELVVLAADVTPIEIITHLPTLCEDNNVPHVFIPSKSELGFVCRVSRPVIAATINKNEASDSDPQIKRLKEVVERLAIESAVLLS